VNYDDMRLEEARRLLRNDKALRVLAEFQLKVLKAILSDVQGTGENAYRKKFCSGEFAEYDLADIGHAKVYAKMREEEGEDRADERFIASMIVQWEELTGRQLDRN
jgi:hypothetical protein